MAISTLTIFQDNKVGDSNLMPIHSPLIFLVDAEYTGADPYFIYCKIYNDDDQLLGIFKCIPYKDLTTAKRRFMFIADTVLQGYMEDFEDTEQSESSFIHIENITKVFKIEFTDPEENADPVEINITTIHGIRQFGNAPNLNEIFNNETETIFAYKNKPCYVYFFNDNEDNVIGIGYEVKFIIDDGVDPVDEVLIIVDGKQLYTNTSGEATFNLLNGNYSYTIYKEGFVEKSNNFAVNGAALIFEITLIANTVSAVTFHAEYDSVDQEDVFIEVYKLGLLIASGYTNPSGDLNRSLYLDTYDIKVSDLYWEYYVDDYELPVITNPQTDDIVIQLKSTYAVTFYVRHGITGDPIVGATIGSEAYAASGNPLDVWRNQSTILTTLGDGKVTVYELSGSENCGVRAKGYTSAVKPVTILEEPNLITIQLFET